MKQIRDLKEEILNGGLERKMKEVYVDSSLIGYHTSRYVAALDKFKDLFGEKEVEIFSAPGRSGVWEIIQTISTDMSLRLQSIWMRLQLLPRRRIIRFIWCQEIFQWLRWF